MTPLILSWTHLQGLHGGLWHLGLTAQLLSRRTCHHPMLLPRVPAAARSTTMMAEARTMALMARGGMLFLLVLRCLSRLRLLRGAFLLGSCGERLWGIPRQGGQPAAPLLRLLFLPGILGVRGPGSWANCGPAAGAPAFIGPEQKAAGWLVTSGGHCDGRCDCA